MSMICEVLTKILEGIKTIEIKAPDKFKRQTKRDDKRYDHLLVTDEMLGNLIVKTVTGTSTTELAIDEIVETIGKANLTTNKENLRKELQNISKNKLITEDEIKDIKADKLTNEKVGEKLRNRLLGMKVMMDSLFSEMQIAGNMLAADSDIEAELKKNMTNGLVNIHESKILETLGREWAASNGWVIDKETRATSSKEDIQKLYIEFGRTIVEDLIDIGVLSKASTDGGQVLSNTTGSGYIDSNYNGLRTTWINMPGEMYALNPEMLSKPELVKDVFSPDRDSDKIAKALEKNEALARVKGLTDATYKWLMSSNYVAPLDKPTNHNTHAGRKQDDIKVADSVKDTLDGLGHVPMRLDPGFKSLLQYLANRAKEEGKDSGKFTYGKWINEIASGNEEMKEWIGFLNYGKIKLAEDPQTEISRMISNTNAMKLMFENAEEILEIFENDVAYVDHRIGKNGRLINALLVLNAQADNKVSRPVLTTEKYNIDLNDKDSLAWFITDFKENYKINPLDIYNNEKTLKWVDSFIVSYMEGNVEEGIDIRKDGEKYIEALKHLKKAPKELQHKKSVYHTMNAVVAVAQMRYALANDKPMQTRYMFGPDANASGGIIKTVFNLGTKQGNNYEALSAAIVLGLIDKNRLPNNIKEQLNDELAKDGELVKDFYHLMLNKIDDDAKKGDVKATTLMELVGSEDKEGVFSDLREMLKQTIMVYLYGQQETNSRKELKALITDAIYESEVQEKVEQILDGLGLEKPENLMTLETRIKVADAIDAKYGDIVQKYLDTTYKSGMFQKSDEIIVDIYSQIEAIAKNVNEAYKVEDIRIEVPMNALDADLKEKDYAERREYGTKLTKELNMVHEDGRVSREDAPNSTTALVVGQHLFDAATLVHAYKKYFENVLKPRYESKIADSKKAVNLLEDLVKDAKNKEEKAGYEKNLKGAKKELSNAENGWKTKIFSSLHIHDQIKGDLEFSKNIEKYYREAFKELHMEYDYRQALARELRYAMDQIGMSVEDRLKVIGGIVKDKNLTKENMYSKLEGEAEIKIKQEVLKKAWIDDNNIFGNAFNVKGTKEELAELDMDKFRSEIKGTIQESPKEQAQKLANTTYDGTYVIADVETDLDGNVVEAVFSEMKGSEVVNVLHVLDMNEPTMTKEDLLKDEDVDAFAVALMSAEDKKTMQKEVEAKFEGNYRHLDMNDKGVNDAVNKILKNKKVVGHNIKGFDADKIKEAFGYSIKLGNQVDTLEMAYEIEKGKMSEKGTRKLSTLIKPEKGEVAHYASTDVMLTSRLLKKYSDMHTDGVFKAQADVKGNNDTITKNMQDKAAKSFQETKGTC